MPIYISLLRGINVGAHKRIKMEQLRASFAALGFEQVQTYIQSGNVIFKTTKVSPSVLSKRIEARILSDFGFQVSVVSRTVDEMAKTVESNPFFQKRGFDQEKLHVMFLSNAPAADAVKRLAELTVAPDQSHCFGQEIYLYLPNGVSGSDLMKRPLDRILSVVTTTRNWKTVNTLHQICQECR
ncbi:MAG: hypothetical protein JWQ87_4685 [Candidatus Sulfotelmatobacter sp.]|nr:hypothetical protein [Candidatus Sulfotelmatobacter sp.]